MQVVCRTHFRTTRSILTSWRRSLHSSIPRHVVTQFAMPAMSPTMSEGGIARWKMKEGESFSAGDVLLEIETDKATIDIEAQDDGVLGKILRPDGSKNVPVGETIALIAEEGDDITGLELPHSASSTKTSKTEEAAKAEERTAATTDTVRNSTQESVSPPPLEKLRKQSSRPLLPSVHRLLVEYGVRNADDIKGTGLRGILTKGDVLAHLGKVKSPFGTYKPPPSVFPSTARANKKPLDGRELRQLIVQGLAQPGSRARATRKKHTDPPSYLLSKPEVPGTPVDFDSLIADYLPPSMKTVPPASIVSTQKQARSNVASYFDGLL